MAANATSEAAGKPLDLVSVSYSDWLNHLSDPYIQVGEQWRRNISAAPGQANWRAMLGAFIIRIGGNV